MSGCPAEVALINAAHDGKIVSRAALPPVDGRLPAGWEVFDIDGQQADEDATTRIGQLIAGAYLEYVDDDGDTCQVVPTTAGLRLIGVAS